jgi:predicted PurR-regulated permease PerM
VLSLVGYPIVKGLGSIRIKNIEIPKSIRAFIALLVIWTIFIGFFRLFVPLIIKEVSAITSVDYASHLAGFNEPIQQLEETIGNYITHGEKFSFQQYLTDKLVSVLNPQIVQNVLGSMAGILGSLLVAVMSVSFITFFFLKDEKLFTEGILMFIPDKYVEKVNKILSSTKKLLARYFIGIILQISGIITLMTIGLTIVGIDFERSVVLGLFMGLLNIIPYIGPLIGIFSGLVILFLTNLHLGFTPELGWFMFYSYLVYQSTQLIDNIFFQPFIFSNSVKAHPLEIFIVILISASLGGIVAMVLAIPVYTIIRVIAKEFFSEFKAVQKITNRL